MIHFSVYDYRKCSFACIGWVRPVMCCFRSLVYKTHPQVKRNIMKEKDNLEVTYT